MNKCITPEQAAELVKDNDTIAFNGFGFGFGFAESLARALGERYAATSAPKNLTLLFGSGVGDGGLSDFGLDHLAQEGMVKRVVGGHIGLARKLSQMIREQKIEAYNFPQGVITHLYRAIAGNKPGVITHVGLKTFADPRIEGGKMNSKTTEDLVEVIEIGGKEKMFYHSMPIKVAFIRGTRVDEKGNLTVEKEGVSLETLHIVQATKNSGGIVIAQAEQIVQHKTLNVREIAVPGILVDYIVKAEEGEHKMNAGCAYDPSYTGEAVIPVEQIEAMPMSVRKVISRRCAMELNKNTVINLGIGVPEGVAAVALEEGIDDWTTMTIEAGSIGGIPGSGMNLGGAANVEVLMGHPNMFDFYDGGGLDATFLGMAQADQFGNINVSKFNGRMVGCGGFVNISQNTKNVVFCGTFTAGSSDIEIKDGALCIKKDGNFSKFVNKVEQVTFSGAYAVEAGQNVLYVTERAVFRLEERGMVLIEIAPGVDLQKDILDHMEFKPIVSETLKTMDASIFAEGLMGLKDKA